MTTKNSAGLESIYYETEEFQIQLGIIFKMAERQRINRKHAPTPKKTNDKLDALKLFNFMTVHQHLFKNEEPPNLKNNTKTDE